MSSTSPVHRVLFRFAGPAILASLALACGPPPSTTPTSTVPTDPGSTVVVPVGSETITVSGPPIGTLAASPAELGSLPEIPAQADTPLGALAIELRDVPVGSVQRVTVQLSRPADAVRKLIDGSWQRFVHDGVTGATIDAGGTTITLDLQDGGRGDSDGIANGTIVDPIAPIESTQLTIPDQDLFIPWGVPFSHQLVADGAIGQVQWQWNGSGELLPGVTLSSDGVLSGTTTAPHRYVTVHAYDEENWVATKLLRLGADLPPEAVVPTGASLPDGVALDIGATGRNCAQPPCGWTNSVLRADGTVVADERFPAFPNGPGDTVVIGNSNGYVQLDADTGQFMNGLPQSVGGIATTLSRDRSRMALSRGAAGIVVYDTATWNVLRIVPSTARKVIWSPDASEFAAVFDGAPLPTVQVHSASDPGRDRTIGTGSRGCVATDWSVTDRLALKCEVDGGRLPVLTLDAQDGSDVRTILSEPCTGFQCSMSLSTNGPLFSPSGSHLAIDELWSAWLEPGPPEIFQVEWNSRVVVVPDADGATPTPLTEAFVTRPQVLSGFGLLASWRWS